MIDIPRREPHGVEMVTSLPMMLELICLSNDATNEENIGVDL